MKRFRFNLDAVRDVREDREDAAKRVLAERIREHQAQREAAEASLRRFHAATDALRRGAPNGAGLVQADRDRDHARLLLEREARALEERSHGVERARQDVVAARTALEAVRKLEAKRRAEHEAERLRLEDRERLDLIEARAARQRYLARRAAAHGRAA